MVGDGVIMRPVIPTLSLVAVSAVFFWFVAAIISNMLVTSIPTGSGLRESLQLIFPYHLQGILGLISLAGCTVFLATTRTQNPAWSLGVPLGIVLAVAAVLSILSKFIVDPGYLIGNAAFVAISLLPLCSALFFLSRKKAGDRVNTLFTVTLVIGVLSLLLIVAMFFQASYAPGEIRNGHSVYEGWSMLYLVLGMPVVGIVHLMHAGRFWRASRNNACGTGSCPEG